MYSRAITYHLQLRESLLIFLLGKKKIITAKSGVNPRVWRGKGGGGGGGGVLWDYNSPKGLETQHDC